MSFLNHLTGEDQPARGQLTLSLDDVGFILSNSRRRHLIHILHARGAEDLNELAHEIATAEPGDGGVKAARIGLYQEHCPQLVDASLIEEPQTNVYTLTQDGERFAALLDHLEANWIAEGDA